MATLKAETKIYTGIGLDFETGSLDNINGACTQLAMQAIRLDTMETIDRYVKYIAPYRKKETGNCPKRKILKNKHEINKENKDQPMIYEQDALTYSGITMDLLISSGVDITEVGNNVIDFAKRNTLSKGHQAKPVLIGQNIPFDIGFLQQLINYTGLLKEFEKVFAGTKDFYGNFQPHYIDTISLAKLAMGNDPTMNSYKLELISERLGLEHDDAHDAGADVTACLNILRVCSGRLRNHYNGIDAIIEKKEKTRNYFKI